MTNSPLKWEVRSLVAYNGGGFMGRSYISSGGSSTRAPSCSTKRPMSQYSFSSVRGGGGLIRPHASVPLLLAPGFLGACASAASSAFQMCYPAISNR